MPQPKATALVKTVAKHLTNYVDVQRREDGWDLSTGATRRVGHEYDTLAEESLRRYFAKSDKRRSMERRGVVRYESDILRGVTPVRLAGQVAQTPSAVSGRRSIAASTAEDHSRRPYTAPANRASVVRDAGTDAVLTIASSLILATERKVRQTSATLPAPRTSASAFSERSYGAVQPTSSATSSPMVQLMRQDRSHPRADRVDQPRPRSASALLGSLPSASPYASSAPRLATQHTARRHLTPEADYALPIDSSLLERAQRRPQSAARSSTQLRDHELQAHPQAVDVGVHRDVADDAFLFRANLSAADSQTLQFTAEHAALEARGALTMADRLVLDAEDEGAVDWSFDATQARAARAAAGVAGVAQRSLQASADLRQMVDVVVADRLGQSLREIHGLVESASHAHLERKSRAYSNKRIVSRFYEEFKASKRVTELRLSMTPDAVRLKAIQAFDEASLLPPAPVPARIETAALPAYEVQPRDRAHDTSILGTHALPVHVARASMSVPAAAASNDVSYFTAVAANDIETVTKISQSVPDMVLRQDEDGKTAYLVAVAHGHVSMMHLLLRFGARIDAHTSAGFSAMHVAAAAGHVAMLHLLCLSGGGLVNTATFDGLAPLHCAAAGGHVQAVEFLLASGADPAARTADGTTALAMAQFENHPLVVAALRASDTGALNADASGHRCSDTAGPMQHSDNGDHNDDNNVGDKSRVPSSLSRVAVLSGLEHALIEDSDLW